MTNNCKMLVTEVVWYMRSFNAHEWLFIQVFWECQGEKNSAFSAFYPSQSIESLAPLDSSFFPLIISVLNSIPLNITPLSNIPSQIPSYKLSPSIFQSPKWTRKVSVGDLYFIFVSHQNIFFDPCNVYMKFSTHCFSSLEVDKTSNLLLF